MRLFLNLLRRDVLLAFRQGSASGMTVAFFVITVTLFPLAVGPDAVILARIGPGVIWVAALLSALLSLDRLFQADFEDGALDLLVLSPLLLEAVVIAKAAAHWLTAGLPLLLIAPVLALFMNLDLEAFGILLLSLALGTPALSLIGAVGAALTVALKRGGALLSLLILPLYVPTLIFGVSAIEAAITSSDPVPSLLLLMAVSLVTLAISPIAAAAALRLALE